MSRFISLIAFLISAIFSLHAQPITVKLCSGNSTSFSTPNIAGKSYQWQVMSKDAISYSSVSNNTVYAGSNTHLLLLTNAGSNLHGSSFRCIISDTAGMQISDTSYLIFEAVWTGSVSNSWSDPANWNCGVVPDANTDVIVLSGNPLVSSNTICRSLSVKSPANVQVASGYTLFISNNKPPEPVLQAFVKPVDSLLFKLNNDSAKLRNGIYEFSFLGNKPGWAANDVLVGITENGWGYARKIVSIEVQDKKVLTTTIQASLSEIFQKAKLSFHLNPGSGAIIKYPNSFEKGIDSGNLPSIANLNGQNATISPNNENGINFTIEDRSIFSHGSSTISIKQGNVHLDADWDLNMDYDEADLKSMTLTCHALKLDTDFELKAEFKDVFATPGITAHKLAIAEKGFFFFVPIGSFRLPVYIELSIDLEAKVKANAYSQANFDVKVQSSSTMDIGLKYDGNQWTGFLEPTTSTQITNDNLTLKAGGNFELSLGPTISVKLYRVVGPIVELVVKSQVNSNATFNDYLFWDFKANSALVAKAGVEAEIFDKIELFDYSKEWDFLKKEFITPYQLAPLSAVEMAGKPNAYLGQPLKVKVTDNLGKPQSNVNVVFAVKSGGGLVNAHVVLTNSEGEASTQWKLGTFTNPTQVVEATALLADGTKIKNAPVIFSAIYAAPPVVVTTPLISCITINSAVSGGRVLSKGGTNLISRGVCWNDTGNPTVLNSHTISGADTGTYLSGIDKLVPDKIYFVRAFAINQTDTTYGETISFSSQPDTSIWISIYHYKWMKHNLNVDTFRNGDHIPQITDPTAWAKATTPAWCYYNNDPAYGPIYGKLYNAYVVRDPRGVCPVGSHVPVQGEGGLGAIAQSQDKFLGEAALRSISPLWLQHVLYPATNCTGFSALPGGRRPAIPLSGFSSFDNITRVAQFWFRSTAHTDASNHWYYYINDSNGYSGNQTTNPAFGMSIRCIKD